MLDTMIVIAKEPVAGRVKTRLSPALSAVQAADVAAAALADTLRIALSVPAKTHLLVLDGNAPPWLPTGWSVVPQRSGGLDQRLVGAFAAAGNGPALLIGMDTPQVTCAQLAEFDPDRFDACLGRAVDGGYWAIGLRESARHANVIAGVPMSTEYTGSAQLSALLERGLNVQLLDELLDVDTCADAAQVARLCPQSEFAVTFHSLTAGAVA